MCPNVPPGLKFQHNHWGSLWGTVMARVSTVTFTHSQSLTHTHSHTLIHTVTRIGTPQTVFHIQGGRVLPVALAKSVGSHSSLPSDLCL